MIRAPRLSPAALVVVLIALANAAVPLMLAAPASAASSAAGAAATPKASLSDVEDEVMCPSCHEPLALAQSPQAIAERNFIRALIAQGLTKAQIERQLVGQYGQSVLARPPAHGFNLTVYILPPALLLAGIALLVITLPRWRARTAARRAEADASRPPAPQLSADDARRLNDELARYG